MIETLDLFKELKRNGFKRKYLLLLLLSVMKHPHHSSFKSSSYLQPIIITIIIENITDTFRGWMSKISRNLWMFYIRFPKCTVVKEMEDGK